MLLDEIREREISAQIVEKWGSETTRVTHQLNGLLGDALGQGDLLGYGFIAQVVAQVLNQSLETAKAIQAEQHAERGTIQ